MDFENDFYFELIISTFDFVSHAQFPDNRIQFDFDGISLLNFASKCETKQNSCDQLCFGFLSRNFNR